MPPIQTEKQKQAALRAARTLDINPDKLVFDLDTLRSTTRTLDVVPPSDVGSADAFQAEIEDAAKQTDSFLASLEKQQQQAQAQEKQASRQLVDELLGSTTPTQAADTALKQTGADRLSQELARLNQQILLEQNKTRRQLEALAQNPQGLFQGALLDEMERTKRESLKKQADLAIIQMGLQGRLDAARSIAQRAVDIQMERERKKLEAAKLTFERNKGLFDRADQRLFSAKLQERERRFAQQERNAKEISDISLAALEQGAPSDVILRIRSAKSPAQAQRIAAEFTAPIIQKQRALEEEQKRAQLELQQRRLELEDRRVALAEREALLRRAEKGDKNAIRELGYDPNNLNGGIEAAQKYEIEREKIQSIIDATKDILKNQEGLKLATGAFQAPLASSLVKSIPAGAALGAGAGTVVPGVGTLLGAALGAGAGLATGLTVNYAQAKNAQMDALSKASFIINSRTFQEIHDLRAQGVTFGNMTEGERIAAGRAAEVLASAADVDESGSVIGFRASEGEVKRYLADIMRAYEGRMEYLNMQYGLKDDDYTEAQKIWDNL